MTAQTRGGVEGDVAALMSQYIEVPTHYCLVFDLFLMEDPFSTEDTLRIYFRPDGQERTMPYLLYEYLEWTDSTWTREKLILPPGKYQLLFMYTMGFPYASATAIDNVDIEPCSHTPGLQGIGQREWSVGKFTEPSKSLETKLNTFNASALVLKALYCWVVRPSICPATSEWLLPNLEFPGIFRRTHRRNGLKFGMLMWNFMGQHIPVQSHIHAWLYKYDYKIKY